MLKELLEAVRSDPGAYVLLCVGAWLVVSAFGPFVVIKHGPK